MKKVYSPLGEFQLEEVLAVQCKIKKRISNGFEKSKFFFLLCGMGECVYIQQEKISYTEN